MGPMSHCSVLQAQPIRSPVVSSLGLFQAQPPVFPTRPQYVPIFYLYLYHPRTVHPAALPFLFPFQIQPLNLLVTLVYIWLKDREPHRGGVT